jgi:excisionase family DNA binding protein
MKDITTDQSYGIEEVADVLGVTTRTVYRMISRGDIKGFREDNNWRFNTDDIQFIADHQLPPPPPPQQVIFHEIEKIDEQMRPYMIYKIENSINELLYVGYTTSTLKGRMKQHIQASRSDRAKHLRNPLYIAMRELGDRNFHISLLEEGEYNLNKLRPIYGPIYGRERYWIGKLNTIYPHGYNGYVRKLTDTDIAIVRYNAYNLTCAQYARLYAISQSNISAIRFSTYGCHSHITQADLPADIEAYAKEMGHSTFMDALHSRADKECKYLF